MTAAKDPNLTWTITDRHAPLDFGVFSLRQHDATHPLDGHSHTFSVIETRDWVNVIPLTASDEVVMVRQFRHGRERVTLEIPGGTVDPGETALEAAARELREETGHAAAEWRHLGFVEPNPAILSNRCDFYLALDVEPKFELDPDSSEVISVERHPLDGIASQIGSGAIAHALVVAAFAKLWIAAGGLRRPV